MLGAGLLLAGYDRDNECEADALAMEHMLRAEYNPKGLIGLMDVLRSITRHSPSVIELMFAAHPLRFFKRLTPEGMERIKESATEYYRYLEVVKEGKRAQYAYQRPVQWGYIKKTS
jgi:predicted Zn-dependent protease